MEDQRVHQTFCAESHRRDQISHDAADAAQGYLLADCGEEGRWGGVVRAAGKSEQEQRRSEDAGEEEEGGRGSGEGVAYCYGHRRERERGEDAAEAELGGQY